ncbi:unnamed protein product [Bursaphelenchus okinawaensis]|uniref:MRG domain-containing protein n=1 Tax=Bursaphelenchus okinawaensis TaxID=465554 RepID=A0A811LFK1_9BILA|nr:unnamed protein product [Bursaphelenchus okinawaensis]CAG9122030.1 unnamed protein product [Bursaphelenchus okinawaensis]
MPIYELQLKATFENVTNLSVDDPQSYDWALKLKCGGCREVSDKFRSFSAQDEVEIPHSRGTANYVEKCGFCGKHATINIVPDSFGVVKESEKFTTICKFETRGTEPVEFALWGKWRCEGEESGTPFEDIELNEWADYDEKSDVPVTINDVEAKFKQILTMAPGRKSNLPPPKATPPKKSTPPNKRTVKKEKTVDGRKQLIFENFKVNDKILCLHVSTGLYYEAKIMDEMDDDDGRSYVVHYQGWNKRYDENVYEEDIPSRFKFYTDESAAEAKDAQQSAIRSSSKRKSSSRRDRTRTPTTPTLLEGFPGTAGSSRSTTPDLRQRTKPGSLTSEVKKGQKTRRSDSQVKVEPELVTVFSHPPKSLVEVLVQDKKKVLEGLMQKQPTEFTVDKIIDLYIQKLGDEEQHENADMFIEYDQVATLGNTTSELQKHIGLFIKDLFNHALATRLLYGPEKKAHEKRMRDRLEEIRDSQPKKRHTRTISDSSQSQSSEPVEEEVKPSSVYGVVHLLRMMVRLADYLPLLGTSPTSAEQGLAAAQDFMVFLSKNVQDFVNMDTDYVESKTRKSYI